MGKRGKSKLLVPRELSSSWYQPIYRSIWNEIFTDVFTDDLANEIDIILRKAKIAYDEFLLNDGNSLNSESYPILLKRALKKVTVALDALDELNVGELNTIIGEFGQLENRDAAYLTLSDIKLVILGKLDGFDTVQSKSRIQMRARAVQEIDRHCSAAGIEISLSVSGNTSAYADFLDEVLYKI